jgi:hypothetical protein
MARNHSLDLRKAVVARLKADAGLIALVPAERVFGEQPSALPAWPFVRYGEDSVRAFSADLPIHSFSKGPFTDEVKRLDAAVVDALDGVSLDIGGGTKAFFTWDRSNLMRDGDEASAWHSVAQFIVTLPASC